MEIEQEHHLTFGPFRLDTAHGRLWRGERATILRPRTLAMLRYLVEHPGRLVTKAELRQHVWAGAHVTDTVLRVCVQEIRAALRDTAPAPRYLQTVERQGYRWLFHGDPEAPQPLTARLLVGRRGEVEALDGWFQRAARGDRQLAFVSGEVGVGKTAVIDLWLARLGDGSAARQARGQCVEHYGEGEPYLPVLEALGQLSRGPGGRDVVALLRRHAPLWLAQLPGLLAEAELEHLQRQVQGATPPRMLRELADALDALTAEVPLVLVLEDLQWSDHATVEALAYVAQRRAPSRLLVLGTYRPVEATIQGHVLRPMVQELCGRGHAVELRLELLPPEDVAAYLTGRLGGAVSAPLAAFVHEHTDGNALFLVNIVEHLVQQRLVVRRQGQWALRDGAEAKVIGLPEGLRQLLIRRLEDLPLEERRVLEAASVAGERFAAAAVAAGAQSPVEDAEAMCEALAAQQHFLKDIGLDEWPDGTSSGRYQFTHALYQQVLYEGLGTTRRERLHRHIGDRLEVGYGAGSGEIAAQLAVHFERGGEAQRAVRYWQQAGENAARRHAYHEAIDAFRKGLALLTTLPEAPERSRRELELQLTLGELLMATKGMVSPEAGAAYTRAHELCLQLGETSQLSRVLPALVMFHGAQAQLLTAGELGQQLFHLAERQRDRDLLIEGHALVGGLALFQGRLVTARAHLEQSLECSAAQESSNAYVAGGYYPTIIGLAWIPQALWALGYADQAWQRSQEGLTLARQLEHTPSLAYAEYYAAILSQARRDVAATQACAEALMSLASAQGFAVRYEQGRIVRGWALAMQGHVDEGVAQIRQGLAAHQEIGPALWQPYRLSLLAEAYGQAGQAEAGLTILAEALMVVATTDERYWEAEVYRLQGELRLQLPTPEISQAEACFQQALAIAHGQQAKALELRVSLSLSRLWRQQGKREETRELLAPIYGWFTEGFDTIDLQEAQALLSELG